MSHCSPAAQRGRWVLSVLLAVAPLAIACEPHRSPSSESVDANGQFAFTSGQPELDQLQPLIVEALAANHQTFDGATGRVAGFGAGAIYPQIWIRDSATLLQVTRYLYPTRYLTSWIEEHLAHQREDGSLFDWIAPGSPDEYRANAPAVVEIHRRGRVVLSADRNSAASDQETSAVLAAAQVFSITANRRWLTQHIEGRPLIERLDAALQFIVDKRINPATGLVTAAFTADWGDVGPLHSGQRAIYREDSTPVVDGLYASAMFAGAAQRLSDLYREVGDGRRAGFWHLQSRSVIEAIDRVLWDEEHGYYRVHQLLHAPDRWRRPDADGVFALGGNAVAALYGVADDPKVSRILEAAAARRAEFGMPTISGVLLPPFPNGTFAHPLLRRPYEYQNGGQWDWWGGRLLLAAFERGHAEFARAELARIAQQIAALGGLYEWSTRRGEGRGSATYAGTGGALGAALVRGLYGIDLRGDGLDIRIRLGAESGRISVAEPATGASVRYDYRYDESTSSATIEYEASLRPAGVLAVRLPPGFERAIARMDDGSERELPTDIVGRDRYARLETDWHQHRVVVTFR